MYEGPCPELYPSVPVFVNQGDNPTESVGLYAQVHPDDHPDMEAMKATRRKRMRQLIDEKFNGAQASFAAAIERQPDYVSRCLHGGKGIGEDLARDIEYRLGLRRGWMDEEPHVSSAVHVSLDNNDQYPRVPRVKFKLSAVLIRS